MSAPRINRALVLEAPQDVPDGAGGSTTLPKSRRLKV